MKRILLFVITFFSITIIFGIGLAAEDSVSFATYYPAPYGNYRKMRVMRMAIGDNYIKTSEYDWETGATHLINSDTDLVVEGNVGIGTASPVAKLEVGGDAKITGGLIPDYDSGWYAENTSTNHKKTLTHDLGVIPSRIQIWFSPVNPPDWVYPVSVSGMAPERDLIKNLGYRNPEGIRVNTTILEYWMYKEIYMFSYLPFETGNWEVFDSGFYRIQMWK